MAKSLEPQGFQGFFFCPDLAFFNSYQGASYGLKRVNFSEWVNRWVKNGLIFRPLSCPFRTVEPSGQHPKRPILFLHKYELDSKRPYWEHPSSQEGYMENRPYRRLALRHLRGRYFFQQGSFIWCAHQEICSRHPPLLILSDGSGLTPPERGQSTRCSYQQAVPFRPTAWLLPRTCSTGTGLRRSPRRHQRR